MDASPIRLDGPVLNPEPVRRTEGADRLGAELIEAALGLPESMERLARLAGSLHSLDPAALAADDTRLALWLNVHNALALHAAHVAGAPAGARAWRSFAARSAYVVGGARYSLALIEHGLLRANRKPPGAWFRVARADDPRLAAAPSRVDPRVLFALHRPGVPQTPPARTYFSGTLGKNLDLATRNHVSEHARVDRAARTIELPRLMKEFATDFGSRADALRFAEKYLAPDDAEWLRATPDAQVRHPR